MAVDYEVHSAPKDLIDEACAIVDQHFTHSLDHYVQCSDDDFRTEVVAAQNELNRVDFVRRFVAARLDVLRRALATSDLAHQSHAYLRATRPKAAVQEAIGYHRESFYGPPEVRHCFNVWAPLRGTNAENALRYIPGSADVPTDSMRLESVSEEDSGVERFSNGHRIGLLYSPKRIVDGIDLSGAQVMQVSPRDFSLFPGELIHGNAMNTSHEIRFSIDFRIIPTRYVVMNKAHFSSDSDYFVPFSADASSASA